MQNPNIFINDHICMYILQNIYVCISNTMQVRIKFCQKNIAINNAYKSCTRKYFVEIRESIIQIIWNISFACSVNLRNVKFIHFRIIYYKLN